MLVWCGNMNFVGTGRRKSLKLLPEQKEKMEKKRFYYALTLDPISSRLVVVEMLGVARRKGDSNPKPSASLPSAGHRTLTEHS